MKINKKNKINKNEKPYSKICKPFEEARAFVHTLNIKNVEEWLEYCKSGKKPNDIPHKPDRVYKNKGWRSYGDWFGVWKEKSFEKKENIKREDKQYLPFEEAKSFVHNLKIKNVKEWFEYCDSGKRPKNIPYNPDRVYKNKGWKSYPDWLGFSKISKKIEVEDLEKFDYKSGISDNKERKEFFKNNKKTDNIDYRSKKINKDKRSFKKEKEKNENKSYNPFAIFMKKKK